ncbi:hypothetical protein ML5_6253 [Micromonospora sp. L5]|nr:hypothetical protein ML5_6253 [Micromonospora sp. L5]
MTASSAGAADRTRRLRATATGESRGEPSGGCSLGAGRAARIPSRADHRSTYDRHRASSLAPGTAGTRSDERRVRRRVSRETAAASEPTGRARAGARASGLPGLGFAARSLIGLATALESCDHPAAPESEPGHRRRRERANIIRPRDAESGRTARLAGRAPRDRRSRLGAPDSTLPARPLAGSTLPGSAVFGSALLGSATLAQVLPGSAGRGSMRLDRSQALRRRALRGRPDDRIGVGRTALARSSRPGVLNPLARQHGHPPIALALAQGLPTGTVGTPVRGTPRHAGPGRAARQPDGPAARRPSGPAARRLEWLSGGEPARVRAIGGRHQPAARRVRHAERASHQASDSPEPSPPALLPDQRSGRAPTRQRRTAALSEPLRTRPSRTQPFSARARGLPPISNADSRFTATTQSPAPVSRETTGEARQPNSRCDPGCSRFDRISAEGR